MIQNKPMMFKYFTQGKFGNSVQLWDNVNDYLNSGFKGNVTIRYKESGFPRSFNVKYQDVTRKLSEYVNDGWDINKIIINQDLVEAHVLFNAEIIETYKGLCVGYVNIDKLKDKTSRHLEYVYGLRAKHWLKEFMCSSSYEDLQVLLELYPEHVIEVSIHDECVGNIPNRNTIFWEVRFY